MGASGFCYVTSGGLLYLIATIIDDRHQFPYVTEMTKSGMHGFFRYITQSRGVLHQKVACTDERSIL